MNNQDLEAKIVVLGAQGVGKTSFLNRYIHNSFSPSGIPSTVGASFLTKRLSHTSDHPDTTIRLQIWDTAGQERFRSISKLYYRGANAAILCYDITDERSFEEMGCWLLELQEALGDTVIVHVVGTKADVVAEASEKRQVPFERCTAYVAQHLLTRQQAQQGAMQNSAAVSTRSLRSQATTPAATSQSATSNRSSGFWGLDTEWDCCHEISAKDGEGVEEVFRVIARKLVEQRNLQLQTAADDSATALATDRGETGRRDRLGDSKGSFRIGIGDKRRSWMGFPVTPVASSFEGVDEQRVVEPKPSGRCC